MLSRSLEQSSACPKSLVRSIHEHPTQTRVVVTRNKSMTNKHHTQTRGIVASTIPAALSEASGKSRNDVRRTAARPPVQIREESRLKELEGREAKLKLIAVKIKKEKEKIHTDEHHVDSKIGVPYGAVPGQGIVDQVLAYVCLCQPHLLHGVFSLLDFDSEHFCDVAECYAKKGGYFYTRLTISRSCSPDPRGIELQPHSWSLQLALLMCALRRTAAGTFKRWR